MAKSTKLGWGKALESAKTMISEGELNRSQHFELFQKFLYSRNSQDHRIAIALLHMYIRLNETDFDRDISLKDLISFGNTLSNPYWKNYGRWVLFEVLKLREVTSAWVDDIADEGQKHLRLAFTVALKEMAKRKRIPVSRTLGLLEYFLDQPETDVREEVAEALKLVGDKEPEKVHYFLSEFSSGAGSYRKALINLAREKMGRE